MKQLQSDFTTPKQSKRLLELGVPADSADFYWTHEHKRGVLPRVENILTTFTEEQKNHYTYNVDDYIIPCWSVGRLIKIANICFTSLVEQEYYIKMKDCNIDYMVNLFELAADNMDFSKLED